MNQPFDSGQARLRCHSLGRLDVNGMKSLLSLLDVETDRIYNAVSAGKRIRDALTQSEREIRDSAVAERCGGRESRFRRTR